MATKVLFELDAKESTVPVAVAVRMILKQLLRRFGIRAVSVNFTTDERKD